jgi:hypothetical protein
MALAKTFLADGSVSVTAPLKFKLSVPLLEIATLVSLIGLCTPQCHLLMYRTSKGSWACHPFGCQELHRDGATLGTQPGRYLETKTHDTLELHPAISSHGWPFQWPRKNGLSPGSVRKINP